MQSRHRLRVFVLALTGALSADLAFAPEAHAVAGPGLFGIGCSTHVTRFDKTGSFFNARGSQTCDGFSSGFAPRQLTIRIQRSRWFGWETMASSWTGFITPPFNSAAYATYGCAGTGTHTFRANAYGSVWLDYYSCNAYSGEIRTAC